MKFSDCIKLAFLNLKSYKKTTVIICIGMLIALCIIISACTYNHSITSSMNDTINNKYSQAYIMYDDEFLLNDNNSLKKIKSLDGLSDIRIESGYDYILELYPNFHKGDYIENYNSIDNSTLIVDGKSYRGINDYSYDFIEYDGFVDKSLRGVYFAVDSFYIKDGFSQFSEAEKKEYYSKHNEDFLIGSEMKNDNDIIMSEYIMSKYGFSLDEAQKLIGKKITLAFSCNGKTAEIVKDYTLCGILRTDFYDVEEFREYSHIFVPMTGKFMPEDIDEYFYGYQMLFFDDFSSALKGYEILEKENDWITLSSTVAVYSEIEQQQTIYNKIVVLILFLIIFAVFVFMLSSVQYYFSKRLKFITLERAIGMKNCKIFTVFMSEFAVCGILSFVVSIPVSYFMITGLADFLNGLVGGTINISSDDFIVGLIFGFAFVFSISLIFALIQLIKSRKYHIVSVVSE